MISKRITSMLLAFILAAVSAVALASPAAAPTGSYWIESPETANPATESRSSEGSALDELRSRITISSWSDVEQYYPHARRVVLHTVPGLNWLQLFYDMRADGYLAVGFGLDGRVLDPDHREKTPVLTGQHMMLIDWETERLVALATIEVGEKEDEEIPAVPPVSAMQQEGIDLVNALRADVGTHALRANAPLCAAAQIRANEMARSGVFDHTRPNGSSCFSVFNAPSPVGENIAYCYGVMGNIPEQMQDMWFHSPGHYGNMINSAFQQMGIAYAQASNGAWYGVQLFSGSGLVTLNEAPEVPMLPDATPEPTPEPTLESTPEPTTEPTPEPTTEPSTAPSPVPTAPPSSGPSATAAPSASARPSASGAPSASARPSASAVPSASASSGTTQPEMQPAAGSGYTFIGSGSSRLLLGPQLSPDVVTDVQNVTRRIDCPPETQLTVLTRDGSEASAIAPAATGMQLELRSSTGVVLESAAVVVKGDVLGTGRMAITQLVAMARALTGVSPLDGPYLAAADWNGSGQLDMADLVREARLLTAQT
ncbi:MAG: hypothetical protein HDQ87_00010 [Clostridia bacterium]|nr:hypothetical protein [Clostridia bacterium]